MGKLAKIKTKPTSISVDSFIDSIPDEQKRKDTQVILKMMEKGTKEKPKMWGSSMIGFGDVRYKSPTSGREVDWFKIGFSPRKANFSLHLIDMQRHADDLKKLGKHKTGLGCLYIGKLEDVDLKVLEKIITAAAMASLTPTTATVKPLKAISPHEVNSYQTYYYCQKGDQ